MGLTKSREKILTIQLGQLGFLALSNAVLGAYTGVVMNLVSVLRNILCLKVKYTWALKLTISAALVGLGLLANNHGLIGVLPIISSTLITCCLDIDDVVKLKTLYIIAQTLLIFYDIAVKNYAAAGMETFGAISNAIAIISVKKAAKQS